MPKILPPCSCPDGCNGCEIQSLEDIVEYLLQQASLRSQENDEGGCIARAAYNLIGDLYMLGEQEGDMNPYRELNQYIKTPWVKD